jgi:TonB-linked SusC/RagA family outer membrane protein
MKNEQIARNTEARFSGFRVMLSLMLSVMLFLSGAFVPGAGQAFGQQRSRVTGTVFSASDNAPIIGATVVLKGTTTGTVTNIDGKFTLDAAAGDVLVFSFVGYKSQEISVGSRTLFDVVLEEDVTDIDEVVVIGYGVQKKKLNTGSTISVKGEEITRQSTVSPLTALQGQTPGVTILKTTGEPGAGFKVNIRGMGTIGNSQPLYVIDGVPGGNIDYLAPSDIETIDVLKDAASAAIYGSRAANGVILVTTKRGKAAGSAGNPIKANITYDGYYGFQNLYKKLPVATAQEYAVLLNEARVNSGQPLLDFAGLVPGWSQIESGQSKGTDWLNELLVPDAPIQNHAVNIFGGGDLSVYSLGLSYSGQEGIFGQEVNSDYSRYSLRLNSDFTLIRNKANNLDLLKVGETLRYSYSTRHGIGTGNQYRNDVYSSIVASPFLPMWAENEEDLAYPYHYSIDWNPQEANPIASMVYNRGLNESRNYNLDGSIFAEIQPLKNLKYRSSFGYRMSANTYRSYNPVFKLSATSFRNDDRVNHSMSAGYSWTWENTLAYDFKLGEAHSFNTLVGMSAEKWGLGESFSGENTSSLFSDFEHAYLGNAPIIKDDGTTKVSSSPWGEGGIISYFGRASYSYYEKYMATAIVRADGSSNFAPGKRWGIFPSLSLGWVISEENFMKDRVGFLDFLKLRASWGQNGNQAINAFQYLATISFANVNYFFGPDKGAVSTGGYPNILPNPDVTWETSDQLNIGFDARMFDSRLSLAFDVYNKQTKDWLVNPSALASYGTNAPYINGGDVSNKGVELGLGWNDKAGDLSYGINANIAYNTNEVTYIANNEGIFHGPGNVLGQGTEELYRAQVGFPIGYFWGYKTLGVFQNAGEVAAYKNSEGTQIMPNAVPGDLIFRDTDDDGQITSDDKVMIGDPNPDFILGFNVNLAYKGWDLTMMTNGALGHQIARSWRRWADSPQNNYTTDVFARWHGEGSSNKYPRLTYGSHPNWQYNSDIFIENADYLRISNLTVGYDLKRAIKAIPLAQTRIYVTAQNLYTFTKYTGMDPEIGTSTTSDEWAKGIDVGYYPSPRTVLVGVSLKF